MSRGPGIAMRTVVDRLGELDAGSPRPLWHALSDIAGEGADRARMESLRRALRSLAGEGLVELDYGLGKMTRRGRPGKLHARLALVIPAGTDRDDSAVSKLQHQ